MRCFVSIIALIICFGCQPLDKPKKPDNLISKDKMVDILYDVLVLNTSKGINKSVLEMNGIKPENYIYEKYNIDSLQFALSNEYYGFYVEDYESIIDGVEKRVIKDEALYKKQVEKEATDLQRKRDSLRDLSDSLNVKSRIKNKEKK